MERLLSSARRRVRLRTRLRRVREAWRRAVPRRLPEWSDRAVSAGPPAAGHLDVSVESAGALRRYAARVDQRATARSLTLVVTDWSAPFRGWSGRLGSLPGLVDHRVDLPNRGRGSATVELVLAEPAPVSRILAAAQRVLEPAPRAAPAGHPSDAHPRGRARYGPGLPAGQLRLAAEADGARWEITGVREAAVVVAGRAGEPLDDRQTAALAELGTVSLEAAPDAPVPVQRHVIAQLAMTGVVLHTPALADGVLAPELAGLVRTAPPGRAADPLEWEIRSVQQRRAAMRHHSRWAGGAVRMPAVSALLVTKRPHLVAPVLAALAAQTYPELEVVVGVHGVELPPAVRDQLTGPVVTIPVERNLGEALTDAARAARGDLLTKVDDDDRYGPEHVWDVVLAWLYSGATVAGKGAEFVYVEPKDRTVRRRMEAESFTDTVAGGTLTVARSELEAVGGWPPVSRWVDRALLDRVLADGGLVYRTHPLGFIYTRHGDGHTWDADMDYFLQDSQRTWQGLPRFPEFGTS